MGRIQKFKITLCFAHKKKVLCKECYKEFKPGEVYFSLNVGLKNSNYSYSNCKLIYCKDCWDKIYQKTISIYELKKDNYGEYLKRRIAKSL